MSAQDGPLNLVEGFRRSGLTLDELYAGYRAMGGTLSTKELARVLDGARRLDRYEHNKLAAALNEYFVGSGHDHPVSYDDTPVPEDRDDGRSGGAG